MRFAAVILSTLVSSSAVVAQTWESDYLEADEAGEVSACTAGIWYSDGPFIVRLYGDEMDFFFSDDELLLPAGEELGSVIFEFKASKHVLLAESTTPNDSRDTTSSMFLTPKKDEYVELLSGLRFSSSFKIHFPDGTNYTIELDGSDIALREAFRCWSNSETGQFGSNPFQNSNEGKNPFE